MNKIIAVKKQRHMSSCKSEVLESCLVDIIRFLGMKESRKLPILNQETKTIVELRSSDLIKGIKVLLDGKGELSRYDLFNLVTCKDILDKESTANVLSVKKLLGEDRFIVGEAYVALGMLVKTLPKVSDELFEKIKNMKDSGDDPFMVLDNGVSILKLEAVLKRSGLQTGCEFGFLSDEPYAYRKEFGNPGWLVVPTNGATEKARCIEENKRERVATTTTTSTAGRNEGPPTEHVLTPMSPDFQTLTAREAVVAALLMARKNIFIYPQGARKRTETTSDNLVYVGPFEFGLLRVEHVDKCDIKNGIGLAVALQQEFNL
jgi:hypothetical protein